MNYTIDTADLSRDCLSDDQRAQLAETDTGHMNDNTDASDLIADALARSEARAAASRPIDYAAANKSFKRQKAALTRAVNTGDRDTIVKAVAKTVNEWETEGFPWPDDWSRWQGALDDALPWNQQVDLRDLIQR